MNRQNFISKLVLCLVIAFGAASVSAQTETKAQTAEPTYEIVLQILNASNAPGKSSDAPALAPLVKRLKTLYAFSDFRVTTTFLQRTADSIEYKSLTNDFSGNAEKSAPAFADWSLRNLRLVADAQGRKMIQFDSFRFGTRIPVVFQTSIDGKTAPLVNYESVGVTTTRFALRENEPTVLGSLAMGKPDELFFLVLTVKAVE